MLDPDAPNDHFRPTMETLKEADLSITAATLATTAQTDQPTAPFPAAVTTLRTMLSNDLEAVNEEILANMQSAVGLIPDLAGHLVNAGGKRIRPMLTLATAQMFSYSGSDHLKLAAAVELIHGATLLHDDVVDASLLRRGVETANSVWGNKESVLVGDYIFSRAFELMVAVKNLHVLQVLSHASGVIAEGEVLQLSTQKNIDTTFEMYLAVINAKTAALFAAASKAGAIVADTTQAQEEAMESFGANFGIAYQLIDDALDYAGSQNNLGKSVGDDFREGKMTLPVVYAVARAKPDERSFWRRVITDGHQDESDFEQACALMERDDCVVDTLKCAKRYADQALSDLHHAPSNEYRDALSALITASVERSA